MKTEHDVPWYERTGPSLAFFGAFVALGTVTWGAWGRPGMEREEMINDLTFPANGAEQVRGERIPLNGTYIPADPRHKPMLNDVFRGVIDKSLIMVMSPELGCGKLQNLIFLDLLRDAEKAILELPSEHITEKGRRTLISSMRDSSRHISLALGISEAQLDLPSFTDSRWSDKAEELAKTTRPLSPKDVERIGRNLLREVSAPLAEISRKLCDPDYRSYLHHPEVLERMASADSESVRQYLLGGRNP